MDILIVANFCSDFSENDNGRFSYLADILSKNHNVEIITSAFYHKTKKKRDYLQINKPYNVVFLNEPSYSKNVCIKRFWSHFIWGMNVKKYLNKRNDPDVIYCAVPSLTAAFNISRYCRKKGIKFIIDIQDLWPEAFQMIISIPVLGSIIFFPFKKMADEIYSAADEICAVSRTYVNRALMVNKKCKDGCVVYLGTDLVKFDQYKKRDINIVKPENEFWLGYCGTLGSSYDLKIIFDALAIIKQRSDLPVKLYVMGDGPKCQEFQKYAIKKRIQVYFMGYVPYKKMCAVISLCDIAINPIVHNAAQSIINKHADYAAAGIPVISTQECYEYRNLVDMYHMGINCENDNAFDIANKIEFLLKNTAVRLEMGRNARRCAVECFDRQNTYDRLVKRIEEA